jgi:hypothetical protein
MPGFVGKQRIPVSLTEFNKDTGREETNVIYIKDKMGYGSRNRVRGSAARNITQGADGSVDVDVNFGQANVALLEENILAWEGPQFEDERHRSIPVTRKWIEELDPEWALVDMTLEAINERNKSQKAMEEEVPNSGTTGSTSPEADPSQLVLMTST